MRKTDPKRIIFLWIPSDLFSESWKSAAGAPRPGVAMSSTSKILGEAPEMRIPLGGDKGRLVKGLGQALGHHVVPESGLGIADTVGQLQDEVTLADLSGKIEKLTEEGGRAGSAGWRSGGQIKVQLLGDKSDERRDVSVQSSQLRLLRDLPVCCDLIDLGNHGDGIQVEETDQEIRRVLRFHTPGLQMFGGKVREVESDDHTTVGPDRRSQDMAIFRIILNPLNERLIALHQCLWKVAPERLVSALDQFGGPT